MLGNIRSPRDDAWRLKSEGYSSDKVTVKSSRCPQTSPTMCKIAINREN